MNDGRELIDRLVRWRRTKGTSQRQVAQLMHTSQPAVAKIETSRTDPRLSTLIRYAAALGVEVDLDFLGKDRT